jgi:NAD(P)-dependent dehydrogenase (short-subunit alcohol dehydrogenase family)
MVELEATGIKVNLVSPGFTRTNLNGYEGTQTVGRAPARWCASLFLDRMGRRARSRAGKTK